MLTSIQWPPHRRFKSRTDWEPIGFFSECLCNSTLFDLMLGFFFPQLLTYCLMVLLHSYMVEAECD